MLLNLENKICKILHIFFDGKYYLKNNVYFFINLPFSIKNKICKILMKVSIYSNMIYEYKIVVTKLQGSTF